LVIAPEFRQAVTDRPLQPSEADSAAAADSMVAAGKS